MLKDPLHGTTTSTPVPSVLVHHYFTLKHPLETRCQKEQTTHVLHIQLHSKMLFFYLVQGY